MNRSELIQYHTEEAAALRETGGSHALSWASHHEDLAEAARVGDYPHPSEQITGTDY